MDYQIWATIALWVIAAFFLVLTLVLLFVGIPIALDVKRSIRGIQGTIDEVRVKADPILFKAQAMAGDIQEMTATARREAERVGASIQNVSERVDDFAALVEVMQEQVEKPLLRSVAALATARKTISRFF
ncbi:MAG TPA: hypothetical protein VFH69_05885 [Gemmatimonadota bacterium]|nr:hypothetical protein [Gemmatimonadota bacterium]